MARPVWARPVWAEVSRSRLLANLNLLRQAAPRDADLLAVVKADAYGHGATLCAPVLAAAGAHWLGVTDAAEGVRVRAVCPEARILLMSGVWPGDADCVLGVLDQRLTPVVWEAYQLDVLERAAAERGLPAQSVAVHLEIDTGMARQGVRVAGPDDTGELATLLRRFHAGSPLKLEGVMTHFSEPEVLSSRPNPQLAAFAAALELVMARGLQPTWVHAGNSATTLAGPDRDALAAMAAGAGARLMLRPGLALYGYITPFFQTSRADQSRTRTRPVAEGALAPVLAWKTRITSLRTVQAGDGVGYNSTFRASGPTRLALLPVGYADGLSRALSNRGQVLVRGRRAPIAGRVSMDQTVVDVSGIPEAGIGDEVVLTGEQGGDAITAWEIAELTGTIAWEVLCAIGARVPRVLVD